MRSWLQASWAYVAERRRERRAWNQATTLADAGRLMVRWLDGEFERWPGHLGPPDSETELIKPTLKAVNLAGFVTTCSQPGDVDPEGRWRKRAGVHGYVAADDTRLLGLITEECARHADLRLVVHRGVSHRRDYGASITVTQGRRLSFGPWHKYTEFGGRITTDDVKLDFGDYRWWLVDTACVAYQITIVDTQWGTNGTLWPTLERVAARVHAGDQPEREWV